MKDNKDYAVQVITELPGNIIRIWEIEDFHIGDDDDPLTTINITGDYEDKKV